MQKGRRRRRRGMAASCDQVIGPVLVRAPQYLGAALCKCTGSHRACTIWIIVAAQSTPAMQHVGVVLLELLLQIWCGIMG